MKGYELFNHFASFSKEIILDMAKGSFTRKEIEYSNEDLEYYSLTNAQAQLAYNSIDISKLLPKSLTELLHCREEEYLEKLKAIRKEHANSLPQKNMWPPEQSLVFEMMETNAAGDPKEMKSFPELKEKIESRHSTTRVVDVKEEELGQFGSVYGSSSSSSLLQGYVKSKKEAFSTKEGPAEEVFNKRWDRTSELLLDKNGNKWKRRLDSIARLIEGNSICAAIALEDNSFLIATNTNFVTNSEAQGYVLINTVMSFFKEVANISDEIYQSDAFKRLFKETFRKICRESMSGLQLSTYMRDELVKDDFIDRVIRASKQEDCRELRDYISQHAEYGHSPADHGSAFFVCVALIQDFDKVIKFIRKNKNNTDHPTTKSFIQAIRNYQTTNIIGDEKLTPKVHDQNTREKMHAEMRILALMDNQLKNKESRYTNYVGISKLCSTQ